jgi:hypothetical protein
MSGTLSTSPSPKSEVVLRLATSVASGGTVSGPQPRVGSTPRTCSSDPPNSVIGSNLPWVIRPNRVSVMLLSPPTLGFEWHATQETSLNTGPGPR